MLCSPFEVGPKELNTVIKGPSELALRGRAVCGDPAVRKLQAPLGHLEAVAGEPESAAGHASAWSPGGCGNQLPARLWRVWALREFLYISFSVSAPTPGFALRSDLGGGGETCRP